MLAALAVACAPTPPDRDRHSAERPPPAAAAARGPLDLATVTIEVASEHQRIDGFGATHLSLVYEGARDVLNERQRRRAVQAVYAEVGLNLGQLDAIVLESPSNYDSRRNDNDDPSVFEWSGFQTSGVEALKQKVLDLPEAARFTNYALGQRLNTRWASPWLADLRGRNWNLYLDEAAEQVVAGVVWWRDRYGTAPRLVHLFNEPLSGNTELRGGNPRDVVELIKRVGERLRREGVAEPRFIVPNEETDEGSLAVARAILDDPQARQFVGVIGYHPYPYGSAYANIPTLLATSGSGAPDERRLEVRRRLRDLAREHKLPLWMTEVSNGGVDARSYDGFRGRANHIHDELVYAEASAYFGMNNMWDLDSHREHFGSGAGFYSEGNIVLIDQERDLVLITGMGRAIGHYARWLTPGSVRLDAAVSGSRSLKATAFRDPAAGRLVVVALNNANAPQPVRLVVRGGGLRGPAAGEQSSAEGYWAPLDGVTVDKDGATLSVPSLGVASVALPIIGATRGKP